MWIHPYLPVSIAWLAMAALLVETRAVHAADKVSITGQRIKLRDVLPGCPSRACEADLGPAPAPGSSRWVATATMLSALQVAGEDARPFARETGVRVTSAARVLSPPEQRELLWPAISRVIPAGVRLVSVEPKSALVVPLLVHVGECTLPALPRRPGPVTTTALVDLLHEGVLVRRAPVLIRLVISGPAGRPDVARGHTLTLSIERGTASISADGMALRDAQIGQVAPFKVLSTSRVVQARVVSAGRAMILEGQ